MSRPLKIWQRKNENGKTITISVWPDRKIRTGYFEKDFWSTLYRQNQTDAEWTAIPWENDNWQDITPKD
jgi:hypothetical protein